MSPYDAPGLVGGLAGAVLFMVGAAIAAGAGLRTAFVLRDPEKGRLARGVGVAGGIIGVCGLALFFGAQATRFRHAFDLATPVVAAVGIVVGVLAARRIARRPPAAPRSEPRGPTP